MELLEHCIETKQLFLLAKRGSGWLTRGCTLAIRDLWHNSSKNACLEEYFSGWEAHYMSLSVGSRIEARTSGFLSS